MIKADLRRQFLAERKALPAEEVERRSQEIGERFFSRDVIFLNKMTSLSVSIHTFLPITRQNEVNTWPIIHRIWRELPGVQLSASVTGSVEKTLTHYALTPETTLVENRWGIPEPVGINQTPIGSEQFDIVFVPLLAFDLRGHRVGYGGGYYDRFLAQCRPDCLKIGLSLFKPVDQIDDVDETDIRLDGCVTNNLIYSFG